MKNLKKMYFGIAVILPILFAGSLVSSCTTEGEDDTTEQLTLTQQEKDMLIQMREEEKLARDVYDYLYTKYNNLYIFDNISNSEQMHMDEILTLLNKYNIPDPALPNPGEFSDQAIQDLYDQLTAAGDVSEIAALKVGATIEDLDIYDLEELSTQTNNQDILDVFAKLTCGSRNHMRGFYNQITGQGETYTPQFISQTEYDDIVNSPHERCN